MSVRYELEGSRMVIALVDVLDTMECDLSVDVFLTRVQNKVQNDPQALDKRQTSEMRLFAYNNFYISK